MINDSKALIPYLLEMTVFNLCSTCEISFKSFQFHGYQDDVPSQWIFQSSVLQELTRSIRDSETSIDFVQGPPGSVENGLSSQNLLNDVARRRIDEETDYEPYQSGYQELDEDPLEAVADHELEGSPGTHEPEKRCVWTTVSGNKFSIFQSILRLFYIYILI